MATQKIIITMILIPCLPQRSPGLIDWLSVCMGEKKKEGKECSQLYPAVNRELSDEMENLLSST